MKREVVRDFLNLPGIVGVALIDGRSRPYFCGVDQALNFQQKEALAQGIRQVVETTPDGFESFEFQFTGHQVYIYKLDHGIILLVLAQSRLVYSEYLQAIEKLKATLQEDITKALVTFRLLASDITMSGQNYWKQRTDTTSSSSLGAQTPTNSPPFNSSASASDLASPVSTANGSQNSALKNGSSPTSSQTGAQAGSSLPPSNASNTSVPAVPQEEALVELKELLAALNHLSQYTTQYLGTAVITNYWKSCRPDHEWLQNFQVDRSARIAFSSPIPQGGNQLVSEQQQQWIQEWVEAFIKRCSQVIRDFSAIVEQRALNERQKQLLLP